MTFDVDGAWTRQSVTVGGSEAFETQRVYWLQVGGCYADLRVPFHPSGGTACFAGRSGWDGDRYRWTHRLDLEDPAVMGLGGGPGGDDVGQLHWEGEHLIERGLLGAVPYEEVWVRLPGGEGEPQILEADNGCHVQAGGHAITILDERAAGGGFNACYRVRRGDGEWEIRAQIGEIPVGPIHLRCPNTEDVSDLARLAP